MPTARPRSSRARPEVIGLVGLGLLGRGIAACFLAHGFTVVAVDRSPRQRAVARRAIGQAIDDLVRQRGFPAGLRRSWPARYRASDDFRPLAGCDFVVESVTEDPAAKEEALARIEDAVAATTVVASNTSAIPISRMQRRRRHPGRFIGMHWAEPAHATRFMELIRGRHTTAAAFRAAAELGRRLGKDPCLCRKDVPGFIVNRIGYALYREALHLLETGVADAESIDRGMRNALGLWATVCGPLRWIDLTGGPAAYAKAMQQVLPTLSNARTLPPAIRKLADSGARGILNGRGFFRYTPAEAHRWEKLYRRHALHVAALHDDYFPLPKRTKK
ncbi:MAG: 3-hydroxyacyl-CoA dehydrogenase family protein [Opitutaceae bacterium]|nr:3-hydroxyacyl-CoA dehydrogenase family protein [Opitutaceae bacterium]